MLPEWPWFESTTESHFARQDPQRECECDGGRACRAQSAGCCPPCAVSFGGRLTGRTPGSEPGNEGSYPSHRSIVPSGTQLVRVESMRRSSRAVAEGLQGQMHVTSEVSYFAVVPVLSEAPSSPTGVGFADGMQRWRSCGGPKCGTCWPRRLASRVSSLAGGGSRFDPVTVCA